jgi:hypothetical protein
MGKDQGKCGKPESLQEMGWCELFISESELQRRLNSSKNLTAVVRPCVSEKESHKVQIIHEPMVRQTPDAPEEVRKIAATLSGVGEKVVDIAAALNLSPSQVHSAIKKFDFPNKNSTERLKELALDKTMIALGLMTQEKFENASLKDLSTVAANLSRVMERCSPREIGNNTVQFIVHAPAQKSLGNYEVIDV